MLRMAQAFLQILSSYFVPRALLLSLVSLAKPGFTVDRAVVLAILDGFRSRVALARRFFRVFRFLESFQAAYRLYSPSSPSSGKPAEIWLDILGRSFNGMYLLLETSTLLDVMGVPGFSLLGAELLPRVNVEAQRFWFLALVCGVAGGLVRLVKTFVYAGVPDSGEGFGDGSGKAKEKATEVAAAGTEEKTGGDGDEEQEQDGPDAWRKERERMRQALQARRLERRRLIARIRTRLSGLLRRLVADVCDLPVPGAVIGWIPVDQGTVGVLMVVSTYLTGLDAWERCGREVAATKAEGN